MNPSLQRTYHVVFFWIPERNGQQRFDDFSIQRSFKEGMDPKDCQQLRFNLKQLFQNSFSRNFIFLSTLKVIKWTGFLTYYVQIEDSHCT